MNPPNHRPTEMYLGTSDERRDLLRQDARNRRPHLALYTMLVVVLMVVGAAIVVGPGRAIDWVATYLIPVVVILVVVTATVTLVMWMQNGIIGKLPTLSFYYRQWWR